MHFHLKLKKVGMLQRLFKIFHLGIIYWHWIKGLELKSRILDKSEKFTIQFSDKIFFKSKFHQALKGQKLMIDLSTQFRTVHFLQQIGIKHFGQKKIWEKINDLVGFFIGSHQVRKRGTWEMKAFTYPLTIDRGEKNCKKCLKINLIGILLKYKDVLLGI